MSRGAHNSAHEPKGQRSSRGQRLYGKLGRTIPLTRLERLLGEGKKRSRREVSKPMDTDKTPDKDQDEKEPE